VEGYCHERCDDGSSMLTNRLDDGGATRLDESRPNRTRRAASPQSAAAEAAAKAPPPGGVPVEG